MKKIPYLKWREHLNDSIPPDHRIGTDVMLVDNADSSNIQKLHTEPFKVDMTMAIIYKKGTTRTRINMVEYNIVAPCVIIVVNDSVYQPLESSDDLKCKAIVMSRSFSNSLFTNFGDYKPIYNMIVSNPVVFMDNETNVFDFFYDAMLNLIRSPYREFALESARHLTLAMFYGYCAARQGIANNAKAVTRQESICSDFIDILSHNYKEQREVSFYADRLCITPKYLSQIVKDNTGKTALELIEDYVIEESKAMLISTTMTIQQISDELHFPSQSVFGKYFKRVTGLSPREYRTSFEK